MTEIPSRLNPFFSYPNIFQEEKAEAILVKTYCSQIEYDVRNVYLVYDFNKIFSLHIMLFICWFVIAIFMVSIFILTWVYI